jgi:hypothetical protein
MSIRKRQNKDGSYSYCVDIVKKDLSIYKTFSREDDAKLFEFYKTNLLNNKEAFDIPLKNRVTLDHIIDLKMESKKMDQKEISSFNKTREVLNQRFGKDKYLCQISYDEWLNAAKDVYATPVFRGAVKEKNKRIMTPTTLKRVFAYASSAISNAMNMGIEIDNYALKVIQTHITPMIEKSKD